MNHIINELNYLMVCIKLSGKVKLNDLATFTKQFVIIVKYLVIVTKYLIIVIKLFI